MNAELLYEALNDRHSLEQLSVNDLGRLVGSHPYFSIGQLLLAKKQRQVGDKESYQIQREHLHAFYRNPWWLYYQLELADHTATPAYIAQVPYRFESAPFESIATKPGRPEREVPPASSTTTPSTPPPSTPPPVPEEPTRPQAPEVPQPAGPEVSPPAGPEVPPSAGPELASSGDPIAARQETAAHAVEGEPAHRHGFVPWPGMEEEELEIPTLMGVVAEGAVASHEVASHEVASHEMAEPVVAHEVAEPLVAPEAPYMPFMVAAVAPPVAVAEVPVAVEPEPVVSEPVASVAAEPVAPVAAVSMEPMAPAATAYTPAPPAPVTEDEDLGDPDDTDGPGHPEQEPVVHRDDQPAPPPAFPTAEPAPFPFSLTPLAHDFTFEPLHTVDYFASQGIKLDLDENPTDTFGKHLKSFTEWLKTMKRIHPMEGRHADLDAATEAEIQQLASSANQQRDAIVTESMAHVWVLQGKIHKAVEVYNKLSLQHPEKRAYFAAKIEQLNKL
jgi:hypothetical protein